jgi:hypothetical protein
LRRLPRAADRPASGFFRAACRFPRSSNDDPVKPFLETSMKYLCLIYYDERELDALSPPEFDALVRESLAYDETMRAGGHYVTSNALQKTTTAKSLRTGSGRVSVTDGPFAETKEQLGGFILIEAKDLDDAIRVASKIPPARLGGVEVRPVMDLSEWGGEG